MDMDSLPRHLLPRAEADQTGSNRDGPSSLSALVSTLIPTLLISVAVFAAFLLLRRKFRRVYEPRTFLPVLASQERSPRPSTGFLGWTAELSTLTDEFVVSHSTLDNYLWLRFFKILVIIAAAGCLITWPILFPINITGGGGQQGLNILSFSNIGKPTRYFAHAIVAWVFLGFVMFIITRETYYYTQLRQAYLFSPLMESRISSRTVLFKNVPEAECNEENIRNHMAGAQHVWIVQDIGDLEDMTQEREKTVAQYEAAQVKLVNTLLKKQKKLQKKTSKAKGEVDPSATSVQVDSKDRPAHRLKKLKLPLGKKVDTIDWSRSELARMIPEISKTQHSVGTGGKKKPCACFIEFDTVRAAQQALRQTGRHSPISATPAESGMVPDQVLWKNISLPKWNVKLKSAVFTAIITFLCIFWTIPVGVIGAISNIQALTKAVPFLGFINSIPPVVLGVVTGLLPVVLLAVLMALVPIFCTLFAKTFEPTMGAVQLKVQSWYFAFQVIQVFLITTFSSGAASVVQKIINDPGTAPQLLANNLPKASNFYISYFILLGLLTAAMQMLNLVPLLMVMILGKILDKTPRKMYNRYVNLSGLGWGSLYPKFVNLGVIALSYSIIAPLVLGFATVGFILLYLAFRYNVLFTLGTQFDTKGQCYARALQQLTVGIYLSEICLIGLFAINSANSLIDLGPLIITVALLVTTIAWHVLMRMKMKKLMTRLLTEHQHASIHPGHATPPNDEEKLAHLNKDGYTSNPAGAAASSYQVPSSVPAPAPAPPPSSFLARVANFFRPKTSATSAYISARILSPYLATPVRPYTPRECHDAYLHPALVDRTTVVWLVRDPFGISKEEVNAARQDGLVVSDEAAWVDDAGKVQWDQDRLDKVPIHEDAVLY